MAKMEKELSRLEYERSLWDQFAMEFYRARVNDSNFWTPQHLAEKSYEYATAMMREREARMSIQN